ncbi:hypothetical protein ASG17_04035 [Brevundimonas sp. Leaf363]|uniref:DUF2141 domain-containing protein n=1 Tax=Brevundimonas sp. Leaf363 TaxID=1736353 RepID=UPI0006FEA3C2|nr:DUF2141 domain-containing protein [Brevundimonas sp. Leaf363]KQS55271.1 hypothetical protein ASG17_04035 [Brevundimonas sp. Leaf363]
MKILIPAVLVAALIAGPAFAQSADNSVTVQFETGAATGAVMVGLYDSADAYNGHRTFRGGRIAATGGVVTVTFDQLPAGEYAVSAFHDVNGDGTMNANPFGMPTEPYAFSNNAKGNMGPASWDAAKFAVSGAVTQTITIR